MVATARLCRVCSSVLPAPPAPRPRYHICESCGWEPAPGPQTRFLAAVDVFELLYGGAAGGGKSESLLVDAARFVEFPSYRAVLFRRQATDLRKSLIDRSMEIYPKIGDCEFVGSPDPVWRFASGAKIMFSHLQHESDKYNWDSAEIQYAGFDELSHFTESMYLYIMGRLRSHDMRIPVRIRGGTNPPEDMTGAWIVKRFAPWVDQSPDYHGVRAESGKRLYVIGSSDSGERYVPKGTRDEAGNPARSRMFLRSFVDNNPYVDPTYKSTLLLLDPVTQARKLRGDFSQLDKPGALWERAIINAGRVAAAPELWRIGLALDPSGSHRKGSDEAGIVGAGMGVCYCSGKREDHAFVFTDRSGVLPAAMQAHRTVSAYHELNADFVVAEVNYGGEWVETTIKLIDDRVNVQVIHVSKGKIVRAEPVRALYGKLVDGKLEGCKVHHVGTHAALENEQCTYDPRVSTALSPGRMDALVFVLSKLLLGDEASGTDGVHSDGVRRFASAQRRRGMMT